MSASGRVGQVYSETQREKKSKCCRRTTHPLPSATGAEMGASGRISTFRYSDSYWTKKKLTAYGLTRTSTIGLVTLVFRQSDWNPSEKWVIFTPVSLHFFTNFCRSGEFFAKGPLKQNLKSVEMLKGLSIDTTHSSPSWSFYSTIKFIVKCQGNHIKFTTENYWKTKKYTSHPLLGAAMHGLFYSKFKFGKNPSYIYAHVCMLKPIHW
jgi:hypothetical protein